MKTKPTSSAKTTALRRHANAELRDFADKAKRGPMMAELYRRAKVRLQKRRKQQRSKAEVPKPAADPQRLLHELQVHQVELEMQNEELQKARDEMEAGLEKYSDLYDFAPVGYLTLDRAGVIREANLAGASLLGIARSALAKQRFDFFVAPADRAVFDAFLKQVFETGAREECDASLLMKGNRPLHVRMRANIFESGQACRVAVTDITEHKLAEAVTAQLAAIVKFSSDAIIGKNLDGIITSWNAGAEKIFGYSAGEMVGGSILRLIPSDRQQEEAQIMRRIKQGESMEHFETLRVAKDGRQLNVSVTVSPVRHATGKIAGASTVARDITEHKRAADQVRVSEVRYRRLFETAHDGVLVLNPGTRKITDANPYMTKLLGYPHAQLVGKELFEIGLLKDEVASQEMFRKLKREHEVRYEDLPLESKRGRHQEVEVVASLYQENGHSVIQCNIRDITERKQAEEMLRRNEALFSALVAQAPVGVYVVDARLRLQQANPGALHIFNKVQPLLGRDFSEIIHIIWPKRVADEVVKRFRHTLKTGAPYQSLDFAEQRRDLGVKEFYEWQIQRVTLPAGEYGVVCFFTNITERKRAEGAQRRLDVLTASNRKLESEIVRRQAVEESLQKSQQHQNQLLEESRNMQEQLRHLSRQVLQAQEEERKRISRELHDVIAQTLTGINIRLATLKKAAGHSTADFVRNITRTQRLVEKSVNLVHEFARELRPAVLDDLGLIPALHSSLKNFAIRTGVHSRLTAFAEVEQLDTARRTVLFRVAQEALTNVARHAKASRVEVSIQKLPDGICMKVKDDGKSFKAERGLHASNGKRLGLLGMRERLEMVGGRFEIESSPGKGTTIIAQIPLGKTGGGNR